MDAMLESISAVQFNEWMAFMQIEPFGDTRMDFRFANLMAQTANLHSKRPRYKAKDFMPDFEAAYDDAIAKTEMPKHKQTWSKVEDIFGSLVARLKK